MATNDRARLESDRRSFQVDVCQLETSAYVFRIDDLHRLNTTNHLWFLRSMVKRTRRGLRFNSSERIRMPRCSPGAISTFGNLRHQSRRSPVFLRVYFVGIRTDLLKVNVNFEGTSLNIVAEFTSNGTRGVNNIGVLCQYDLGVL